jgi:hypothetical protein
MFISMKHIYTESETWTIAVREVEECFVSWMPRKVIESETEGL